MSKLLTGAQIAEITELYAQGLTYKEIGKRVGCSHERARYYAQRGKTDVIEPPPARGGDDGDVTERQSVELAEKRYKAEYKKQQVIGLRIANERARLTLVDRIGAERAIRNAINRMLTRRIDELPGVIISAGYSPGTAKKITAAVRKNFQIGVTQDLNDMADELEARAVAESGKDKVAQDE